MSTWKGKTRGGLLGYKIFIFLLQKLGLTAAYLLLRVVAAYYIVFAPTATSNSYKYFRKVHHYSRTKSIVSVYKNFYLLGQTLIDKVAIIAGIETGFTYTFDGEEHLRRFSEANTGGILISAHLGNWEIAGFLLNRIGSRINIVMFEEEHENIKKYLDKVMSNKQVKVIPIKQDLSHIFQIKAALGNKEIICMHGDRFVEGSRIDSLNFMGKDAFFPLGPYIIAAKLKVPFTFVYAVKGKGKKYHLSATPPVSDANISPRNILKIYVETLEQKIKQYPLQWFNYYDFWSKDLKGGIYEKQANEKQSN